MVYDDERYAWIETTVGDDTRRSRVWFVAVGEPVRALGVFGAGAQEPTWLQRSRGGARLHVVVGGRRLAVAPRVVDPDSGQGDVWMSRLRAKYPRNVLGASVEWSQRGWLVVLEVVGSG